MQVNRTTITPSRLCASTLVLPSALEIPRRQAHRPTVPLLFPHQRVPVRLSLPTALRSFLSLQRQCLLQPRHLQLHLVRQQPMLLAM